MDHDALVALVDRAAARGASAEVVARAQEEVSELFLAHQERLYGLCRRFEGTVDTARARAVESIHVGHRRLGEWRGEGRFWPWLYEVGRDVCLRHLAKKQSLLTADGVLIPGSDAARAIAPLRREDREELLRRVSLEVLSSDEQEAVYLRYVEGLEVAEVTEVLHVLGTGARGLLQRSRHKLGLALREPLERWMRDSVHGPLGRHPSFARLAQDDLSEAHRQHLAQSPQCRVDRRRVRDPLEVPEAELAQVRPALDEARAEAVRTLPSSWRSATSGGPSRDGASRLPILPDGTVLGDYRLTGLIERTGMAVAYRAVHVTRGTVHTLRVLATRDSNVRASLPRELRQLRALHHPRVAAVTDHLLVDGCPALVTEFVDGPTLEVLLRHDVSPPLEVVDALAVDVLSGVAAAHAEGIVHRDLRTGTVQLDLRSPSIHAQVTGLGLARLLSIEASTPFGTPSYMAPEQLQDASRTDARSDVFALGNVLYELATGQRCFAAQDHVAAVERVFKLDYVPPRELRPELPERMEQAIVRALQLDPDDRPKSAAALLDIWTRGAGSAPRTSSSLTEGDIASYRMLQRIEPLPEGTVPFDGSTPFGVPSPPPEPSPALPAPGAGSLGAFVGVLLILVLAGAAAAWSTLAPRPASGPVVWPLARSLRHTVDPSLSADGRTVLFSDQVNLYAMEVEAAQPTRLTRPAFEFAAWSPTWSPDGQSIAFTTEHGLWQMRADGRDPKYIAEQGFQPTWSPDGDRIAFVTAPGSAEGPGHSRPAALLTVNIRTGERGQILDEVAEGPAHPAWSPDGIRVAWSQGYSLWVAAAQGGKPVPLPPGRAWHPVWIDAHMLAVLCEPEPGRFGVCVYRESAGWTGPDLWIPLPAEPRSFDLSTEGRRLVVGLRKPRHGVIRLSLADPAQPAAPALTGGPALRAVATTWDGERLAAIDAERPDRLLVRQSSGRWVPLVRERALQAPSWHPSGDALVYTGWREGRAGVFAVDLEGASERLSDVAVHWSAPAFWSPDGTRLAFTDRGVDPSSPVLIDPREPWGPQLDAQRSRPLDGIEAGPFSPSGLHLLVRVGEARWSVVDLQTGASQDVPEAATSVAWASDEIVVTAGGGARGGSAVGVWDRASGRAVRSEDLAPWVVSPHPAVSTDRDGTVWLSVWRQAGGMQRVDLPRDFAAALQE